MVVAGMATISGREDAFDEAAASIKPQVDRFVSVKDYRLGDAGKFAAVEGDYDYYFACDDDLRYPDDYVETMISAIEEYGRKAVISCHGRILRDTPITSYYRGGHRKSYRCTGAVSEDVHVHVAGTGVMAFHRDTVKVLTADFYSPNMADIWMAYVCQQQRVPQIVIAHETGWIEHLKIDFSETIYAKARKEGDEWQTDVVNAIGTWQTFKSELSA